MSPGNDASRKGLFIVIDGSDGSGKSTQHAKLVERLSAQGYQIELIKFPQYESESSYFVREYLQGNYGKADDVGPYTGSIFYALDRYAASKRISTALEEGKVVIADRYTSSNMAHQGLKFDSDEERNGYFLWLEAIEFKMLGIPRPDITLVLRVPPEISQTLIDNRTQAKDIHELDPEHAYKSVRVYDSLCRLFPEDFKPLDCARGGELMSIEEISDLVWNTVEPLLPPANSSYVSSKTSQATVETLSNSFLEEKDGVLSITEAGREELSKYITNATDNVYAFNDKLSATTIAAAMARLSRRGDDMRITILDEFLGSAGKDEDLLKRVITAYGDDSVQQLTAQHVVVEGASNLLTKKLEWGRLASYLEQSTRYIYFDQKDGNGSYKYYTPDYLPTELANEYKKRMDFIFDTYSEIVHKLTDFVRKESKVPDDERDGAWKSATRAQACDAARPLLPVATRSTVGIFASGQALESLIMHLLSDDLPEARATGQQLLDESRKVMPTFLERADKPDRGGAWQAYRSETAKNVASLTKSYLPQAYAPVGKQEPVTLSSYWPKNEFDIIPDILYEHSELSKREIKDLVADFPYIQKLEILNTFIGKRLNRRQRPSRALEQVHYSWDILCDYGIFRDLQRHRMVDDLAWQKLSPRYGYETPELVSRAGLDDLFDTCFDESLKLYSFLQSAGYELEAQYATLLGHKMRWKVTFNAREAYQMIELRTSPQGHPGYRKLAQEMYDKIHEVHPIIATGMKFVNQDEDPELSRLAAERYTQFKLQQN